MKTKHNILVADTDISNLEFLKNNLSGENYEVTTAVDDTAILQMIEEKKIDLVLLSDQIAKGGTMDLIKNIKASANDRMIPTILMVSKDDPQTRQESAAMGCDDILIKPLIPEEVAIRIDTHLQINYYRPFLNEKEKFEFILDNIDDGIIVFDKELNILHFNKRAKDLFDLDLDALPENFLGHISHMYRVHYDSDLSSDLYKNPIVFDLERPATPELKALFLETKFSTVKNPMGETASIIM